MKPGDILEYRCPTHGIVWQWRVRSVCLGAPRQESLIEITPIMASDGETHDGEAETVWVPEPMTRQLTLIPLPAPKEYFDRLGMGPDDDLEPKPDCPSQTYIAYDIRGAKSLPAMMRIEEQRKAARKLNREVEKACAELGVEYHPDPEGTEEELRAFRKLMDGIKAPHFDKGKADALAYAAGPALKARVQDASVDTLTIGDDEDQSIYERMKDLTSNEWLRDAMKSSNPHRKASAGLIACVDAFAAMLPERSRKHMFEARDDLYAALFPRETPKGHCMICNNTGWISRAGSGLIEPGAPFSQNYKPCPEFCDARTKRGFCDPIPYDPKTGRIVTTDTEDDGV